jgi:CheY-like chemotaxis protein
MAKIVLIDDDPLVRAVLAGFLRVDNHQVLEAESGKQGLSLLAKEQPDLVITDIVMPDTDGFELIMALANQENPQRIIAISGGSRSMQQEMLIGVAQSMPVNRVLAKPVSCETLLSAVTEALHSPPPQRCFVTHV